MAPAVRRFAVTSVEALDHAIDIAIVLVALVAVALGSYGVWDATLSTQGGESDVWAEWKPAQQAPLSFEELCQRNPDVVGWIQIPGTSIDYPVVQGCDNTTYINRDAMGEFSLAGSIFLDYRNSRGFSDSVSIVYGHHMERGLMFGDLERFSDASFFDGHATARLYDGSRWHDVELIAYARCNAYDRSVYRAGSGAPLADAYLAAIECQALHRRDVPVACTDRLLVCSTCASGGTNDRHVVIGKILE